MYQLPTTNPDVHAEFMQGGFSVQLSSNNPFGRIQVDQTIEETANKDTHMLGGPRGSVWNQGLWADTTWPPSIGPCTWERWETWYAKAIPNCLIRICRVEWQGNMKQISSPWLIWWETTRWIHYLLNSSMINVHEPFSRTCFRDACVTSSQMLSMILKVASMWTRSSAWVASSHDRNPCCCCGFFFFFFYVVLLFLLTRSNRLQPIIIQYQLFLATITVTCCMWPVCALVLCFTLLQRASSSKLCDNMCCVDTIT